MCPDTWTGGWPSGSALASSPLLAGRRVGGEGQAQSEASTLKVLSRAG